MTRMHSNSMTAYRKMLDRLPAARRLIMQAIIKHGPITRQGVGEKLGIPINQVTGRVRELLDHGAIVECGSITVDKKKRALLKANKAPK